MSIIGPILGVLGLGGIGAALVFIPGAMAAVTKLATAAITFIVGLPWAKIWWIVPLGLAALVVVIQGHKLENRDATIAKVTKSAADSHAAFLLEKKSFATEKASLDAALAQITDTNNRILAQAADLEQAKRDAAAAVARNANLARSTDARIAALQTAATKHGTPCTLSDEAKKELDNQ